MDYHKNAGFGLSIIIVLVSLLVLAGCSGEDPTDVRQTRVNIAAIISNPTCPLPGDTTTILSVRFGDSYSPGPWPSYHWEVPAGSLLVDNEASVRWFVPEQTGDYTVSVRSSLEDASDVCSTVVSVRNYEPLDTGRKYNLYPNLINGNLFFVSPYYYDDEDVSFSSSEYVSSEMMHYIDSGNSESITGVPLFFPGGSHGGDYFVFTGNGIVASMITGYSEYFTLQSMNVARYNFSGSGGKIVTNSDQCNGGRCDQYKYPFPNDDASMIVMQELKVGKSPSGTDDLFNIIFWNSTNIPPLEVLTTSVDSTVVLSESGDTLRWDMEYWENTKPVFTPDENYIICFSNRTGIFNPSIIPIHGGQPDTSASRTFGIFSDLGIDVSRKAIFQWQPDDGNRLAFIASVNREKTLCFINYHPGSSDSLKISAERSTTTEISEFVWSPDGSRGAVITETGIYIVGSSGEILAEVMEKEVHTDLICGVNWSLDGSKIGFRIGRRGMHWHEAFSALMVYSENDDRLTYVTKGYKWPDDEEISTADFDYRWKRVIFESDGTGLYGPIVIGVPDTLAVGEDNPVYTSVKIVHSWE